MSGLREIVFDTETTGFDARGDDRITEIGCIEIIDYLPTGREFHAYCNPAPTIVPQKVVELTGLTSEFLADKPKFETHAQAFLDFVGDSQLIAHNADFDRGFINAELERAGYEPIPTARFTDTLKIARAKFPGSPASLDALCKRFDVSLSARDKHGAIIDSILLASVYLELNGGRARSLGLVEESSANPTAKVETNIAQLRPAPLASLLTDEERARHSEFIADLGEDMLWNRIWRKTGTS